MPITGTELQDLFEASGHGTFTIDPGGHLDTSRAACVLHGVEAVLSGSAFLAHLRPEDLRTVADGVVRAACEGSARFQYRWGAGDKPRHLRAFLRARHDEAGRVHFQGMVEDVSEAVEAERLLVEAREHALAASSVKSRFLANMSHEIRTPMNAVLGMTRLLLETRIDAEQREYLRAVEVSGEALLLLINEVLDISKIEAGKLELDVARVQPAEILHEIAHALALRCHEKGVELVVDLEPSVYVEGDGDPLRLRQILTNVIGNAVKFTYAGEVHVQARVAAGILEVTVEDTGIGIPADSLAMIFEPFRQVDAETTRAFGGSGLGLAITRELVELMKGAISVSSVENIGTRFDLQIPLLAAHKVAVPADGQLAGRRIGVLCHHPRAVDALVRSLRLLGAAPVALTDEESLHQALQAAGPPLDLVIDQDVVGFASSLELARQARQQGGVGVTTLLARQTARFTDEELRGAGIREVVRKPARPEHLVNALRAPHATTQLKRVTYIPPTPPPAKEPTKTGPRILIAEDDDINARLACKMIEKLGLTPVRVRNGQEAVERSAEETFALVLMDLHMPVLDGLQATVQIRERERERGSGEHLPIVALTASAMRGESERCLNGGMDGFLTKPIRPDTLRTEVERWVTRESAIRTAGGAP